MPFIYTFATALNNISPPPHAVTDQWCT